MEYTYNQNGTMTKDLNKGISNIPYNSLNLSKQLDIDNETGVARNIYTYAANGVKLRVVHKSNTDLDTTKRFNAKTDNVYMLAIRDLGTLVDRVGV